jgi:hypothetical protein
VRRSGRFALLVNLAVVIPFAPARARADEPAPLSAHRAAGASFGLGVGLGAGYLLARRAGWEGSADWRTVGLGAGGGTLAGALLGLGVGGIARARHSERRWPVLAGAAGLTFDGAVLGAIGGGVAALAMHDREQLLHGASIGALAGGGVGLLAALWATFASDPPVASRPDSLAFTLLVHDRAIRRSPPWIPGLGGRF